VTRLDVVFLGERPDPARFEAPSLEPIVGDRARPPGKPHGGLWTCREDPDDPTLGLSWVRWCKLIAWTGSLRPPNHLWRLSAPEPRLLVIDSKATFDTVLGRHRSQWLDVPDEPTIADIFAEIDYAAVLADGYDAVELTRPGLFDMRESWPPTMTTWDVPSILWLAWCFDRVGPLWSRDDATP
jgi:hypothetical protein